MSIRSTRPRLALIEKYSDDLEAKMVETVGKAIADLAPARLAAGQGTAGFAVNRRNNLEPDVPRLIAQGALKGPVDHSVPVLAVYLPDGKLKAVLFGYACHNTVMDFYKWCGDYAGFAQLALEKSHPDATAMFFMGCGADQNALPRRQLELAERYGQMLAAAVEEALLAPPRTLAPELRTTMEMVTLHLGPPPTEAELEKLKTDKTAMTRRWATRLLADLKAGKPFIRTYPLPAAGVAVRRPAAPDHARRRAGGGLGAQVQTGVRPPDLGRRLLQRRDDLHPVAARAQGRRAAAGAGALGLRRGARDDGLWAAGVALGRRRGGPGQRRRAARGRTPPAPETIEFWQAGRFRGMKRLKA